MITWKRIKDFFANLKLTQILCFILYWCTIDWIVPGVSYFYLEECWRKNKKEKEKLC